MRLKVITLARLKKLGACPSQVALFEDTFGRSAKITPANMTRAKREGLYLRWIAEKLFGPHDFDSDKCRACVAMFSPRKALLRMAR